MKSIKFSAFILVTVCFWYQQLEAQTFFYAGIPIGEDSVEPLYLTDATYAEDQVSWVASNRSVLTQEKRLESIVKKNTLGVSPFLVEGDVCWRESETRGAGTIPTNCSGGKEYENGLCYVKCTRPGFEGGGGPLCLAKCPRNFTDTGLHCLKPAAKGRGAGRIPDVGCPSGWNKRGVGAAAWCDQWYNRKVDCGLFWCYFPTVRTRSATITCRSNEDKNGGLCYPKCSPGYYAVGCCVCSPSCPANTVDIGVSCQKDSYGRGVGTIPDMCKSGEDYDAGLCYRPCTGGRKGVGPVCWETTCPSNYPVNCGLSCAKSTGDCIGAVVDQVVSPLEMVLNIAGMIGTGGGSAVAKTAGKVAVKNAAKVTSKATIKSQIKAKAKKMGKKVKDEMVDHFSQTAYEAQLTGDFDWEDLDPTGIANIVKAYNKPLCADVKSGSGTTGSLTNVALRKRTKQYSTSHGGVSSRAVDGNTNGNWGVGSVTHTTGANGAWWEVDLGQSYSISQIKIHNRTDCCSNRLNNFSILVSESAFRGNSGGHTFASRQPYKSGIRTFNGNARGRYVRIFLNSSNILSLAEVEVMGRP